MPKCPSCGSILEVNLTLGTDVSKIRELLKRVTTLTDSFTIHDLAAVRAKLLDLKPGSNITIQRDRTDPNRVMLVKETENE